MTAIALRARAALYLVLLAAACGSSRHPQDDSASNPATGMDLDSGVPPARLIDGGLDAAHVPGATCYAPDSGVVCDDRKYCDGVEVCAPSDPKADARGCVAGTPVSCSSGQTCSEAIQMCSLCGASKPNDEDGDGHPAIACGGNDCNDNDPEVYPGHPEICDGKDNDCDGTIDGPQASAACMPPSGATAVCTMASCVFTCSDPDFDLVAGSCVKHDDCAGVTACAPGSCVDGVRAFTCSCPTGYTGTTSCADIDECATPSANDCDRSPSACVNDPGSFHCACPATHYGDGVGASGCIRKALSVAAGDTQTCAVLNGGGVKCWGSDDFGKLGYSAPIPTPRGASAATMGDALPFVALGMRTAKALAVGTDGTCSLLDDASVKCWGYNGYGATGASDPNASGISNTLAPLPPGRTGIAVGAGSGLGYALLDDGTLGTWGYSFGLYAFVPGERFTAFDRSPRYDSFHICALVQGGALRCFPGNASYSDPLQYGPLGWAYNATLPPANYPLTNLGTGRTATAVATGESHSCALLDDASVKCWGRNDHGQLGLGDTLPRGRGTSEMGDALLALPFGAPVRAIAAGANHTCALFDGGVLKCWGLNDRGQLGQGNTQDIGDQPGELQALKPVDLGPGRSAVQVDLGGHSCALLDNGALKCWGANASGQLGVGDTLNRGETPGSMGAMLPAIDVGG